MSNGTKMFVAGVAVGFIACHVYRSSQTVKTA